MVRRRGPARFAGACRGGLVALAALSLAACAFQRQEPGAAPPAFAGPRFEGDAFVSFDGARLGLSRWLPEGEPAHVIVAVHGMSEYGEAFYLAAPFWAEHGVAVYAYDQRGFGRSPNRGVWPGDEVMLGDVRAAVAAARRAHPGASVAVLGESMGAAAVILAAARAEAPLADAVILSAPAVRGWSALPWHYRVSLWTAAHVAPGMSVRPPRNIDVQATDNIAALIKNGNDPLFLMDTRMDALYGLVGLMEEAAEAPLAEDEPTLVLYGAKDELILPPAVEEAVADLGPCGRTAYYPQGWHMLLRDLQAETVWRDVLAFLDDPEARLPSGVAGIPGAPADRLGDAAECVAAQ
jgi:alpha-beta hydrolase superfamily lysophospholipase